MPAEGRIKELRRMLRQIEEMIEDEIGRLRAAALPSADLDDPEVQLALADCDLKDFYDLRNKVEAELHEELAKADSRERLFRREKTSRPH